jgi:hypothetical protein
VRASRLTLERCQNRIGFACRAASIPGFTQRRDVVDIDP